MGWKSVHDQTSVNRQNAKQARKNSIHTKEPHEMETKHNTQFMQITNQSTRFARQQYSYRRDHGQRAPLRHAGRPRIDRRLRAVDNDMGHIVRQLARLGIRVRIRIGRRIEIGQ